jgi:pimeloyl-ACP methyl ester carboxylesterase
MAASYSGIQAKVRSLHWYLPVGAAHALKPVVVLLHGLGGDHKDWRDPFQDRNWPYDHHRDPKEVDLGVHGKPPIAKLPGIQTQLFLSPRLASNQRGADGSDDRSWWHALIQAGFPLFTYSQLPDLMLPFSRGPVAQFKQFMEMLQRDVLRAPEYQARPVVIVGHSRGGLIARAYLGDPDVKADHARGDAGRFPNVTGLITISSPHQGSQMALLDDKIINFLSKVQEVVPTLPNDVGNQVIEGLKAKIDAYVGAHGDEIEPGSPMFQALEAQEPIRGGVRCISIGGTSPRLLRVYLWTFTGDSMVPKRGSGGKLEFHWRAKPLEAKAVSPVPDGLPLKLLGIDLEEVLPGRGDGLTADKRCRFPASFGGTEHFSFPVSHAEELWDPKVQAAVVGRLNTFRGGAYPRGR